MISSTPSGSSQFSSMVSFILKSIGVILVVSALVDIAVLAIPYQLAERSWQIAFVTQVVDRGLVPLVGMALIVAAQWIDTVTHSGDRPSARGGLSLTAFILASVLGAVFILCFPLHLSNLQASSGEATARIEQETTQAETQLDERLQTEIGQQRQQLERLLANPTQLDQALESGLIPQDQATLLRQFRQDPTSLNTFIDQRTSQLRQQLQDEIAKRRQTALDQTRTDALKSGLRIGISSILLAIGYILTGWMGLKTRTLSIVERVSG